MIHIKGSNVKDISELNVLTEDSIKLDRNIPEGEKPSIISDTVFKTMFINEKRIKYSAKLISYFIEEYSYEDILNNIYLVNSELPKDKENTKGERCDYIACLGDTRLNIEINNNYSKSIIDRNVDYSCRIYSNSTTKGQKYNYCQTIQFNINNFSYEGIDTIIDYFYTVNKSIISLHQNIIYINIYIPNLMKKCYNKGIKSLTEVEKYIYGLIQKDISISEEIGEEITIMKEFTKEIQEVMKEESFGESYDKEWALKDLGRLEGIKEGKIKGIEEGKIKGIEEGKSEGIREVAKNFIKSGFDIETVAKNTNLSIKEVEELKSSI